jgi:uroporphyrinogen-III synthase
VTDEQLASAAGPLAGVRIAVTRAEGRGGPLADALRATGASVTEIPLTCIETLDRAPLAQALSRLVRYHWLLLTSVNAVQHVADALRASHQTIGSLKIAVVGSATAEAAQLQGWHPTLVPERFLAEGLVDAMAARGDVDGARMLYPAAEGARDVLPAGLRALGADVDVIPVYRSAPDAEGQARLRSLVAAGALDLVTVAAPSTVDALLAALPAEHARRLPVACIGPVTARAARLAGFPVKVEADSSTTTAFVRSIVAACSPIR